MNTLQCFQQYFDIFYFISGALFSCTSIQYPEQSHNPAFFMQVGNWGCFPLNNLLREEPMEPINK